MKNLDVQLLEHAIKMTFMKFKIDPAILTDHSAKYDAKIPASDVVAYTIMETAGIPQKFIEAALYGLPEPKCDNEMGASWSWASLKDGYKVGYAVRLARQFVQGITKCEVGMKYPQFKKETLIKKYALTKVGTFEPEFSRDREQQYKTIYEIWRNADNTIQFSFEAGRMGVHGYAGATFPDFESAYKFASWFLNRKTNYVKDMDLFFNTLGGVTFDEVEKDKLFLLV